MCFGGKRRVHDILFVHLMICCGLIWQCFFFEPEMLIVYCDFDGTAAIIVATSLRESLRSDFVQDAYLVNIYFFGGPGTIILRSVISIES